MGVKLKEWFCKLQYILDIFHVWCYLFEFKICCSLYPARTTDTQRELFFKNSKLLGLGKQIGLKFYDAFWVFLAKL